MNSDDIRALSKRFWERGKREYRSPEEARDIGLLTMCLEDLATRKEAEEQPFVDTVSGVTIEPRR